MTSKDQIRDLAEKDLYQFARLVNPLRVYGDIHRRVFKRWMDLEKQGVDSTGVLLPRDHQKSHCAAVKAAWLITRDPATTILYISATSGLAEKQLKAIKDILTSDIYRRYWPEMVNIEEGKREKWTNSEICVDHPKRREEKVRDSTVFAAGLTTNITGLHANHTFLDDVVVPANAYTEEGREAVMRQYSQLASIATTGATETVVGTRYHPLDIYNDLINMTEQEFDDEGNIIGERHVYDFMIESVETDGVFLWPKEARASDGKIFGFDNRELARKKAKYLDTTQFYAQYYQETNHESDNRLGYGSFQYYDRKYIEMIDGDWYFKDKKLNVYAAIDFAFSLSANADYSAIAVIGIDSSGMIYVLDLDRFKVNKVLAYYDKIMELHFKWEFRKLGAEATVAQQVIVNELKDMITADGVRLSIKSLKPIKNKEERIAGILEHRYENESILHFKGGYTGMLEEEVVKARPAHDDLKDALASAIEIAQKPSRTLDIESYDSNIIYHPRFGGIMA